MIIQSDTANSREFGTPSAFSGQDVLSAFHRAYPLRVGVPEWRFGDWSVMVGDMRFYYAAGRLLPEDQRKNAAEYSPHPFYNYSWEIPPVRELDPKQHLALERRLAERDQNPQKRHPGFYAEIFRIHNREEAYKRTKTIYFLGKKVLIHRDLLEDLARVEEKLEERAKNNLELARFIAHIQSATGSNWRQIAGTSSISFHSFGAAMDILPDSLDGKQTYWLWTREHDPYWYKTPYSRRYQPPELFIRTFEEEGFIWGGKWFFYDTMHFEYRPEILILNNMR